MVSYLLRMMTSWAIVCDVWYMPAMHQKVCIMQPRLGDCKLSIIYHITFYHPKMAGGGRRYPVRQQSQVSHCPSRRAGGFTVVR